MEFITIRGKRYIIREDRKSHGCRKCAFIHNDLCDYKENLGCISRIGLDGYFIKDTFINRLKTLLNL